MKTYFRQRSVVILITAMILTGCGGSKPQLSPSAETQPTEASRETGEVDVSERDATTDVTVTEDAEVTETPASEHTVFESFLKGETPMWSGEKSYLITDNEFRLIYDSELMYTTLDLNDDGTEELLLKEDENLLYFVAYQKENNRLILLNQPFYSGCRMIGICSDKTIYMCDDMHAGRELYIIGRYEGGNEILEDHVIYHEFYNEHYQVDKEQWMLNPGQTSVEITQDAFEKEVEELNAKTIEPDWKDISIPVVEDAIRAYATLLKEKKDRPDYMPDSAFVLIHIDDDVVPELAYIYNAAHAYGVEFYTYDGQAPVSLGEHGSNGTAYYDRWSGVMYGYWTGQGSTLHHISVLEDGVHERLDTLISSNQEFYPELNENTFEFSSERRIVDPVDGKERYEATELTEEEFMERITPYLPGKRFYNELRNDSLPKVADTDDFEKALRDSLTLEKDLPLADTAEYYSRILLPKKYKPEE